MEYERDDLHFFESYSKQDQEQKIHRTINIPNYQLEDFSIESEAGKAEFNVSLELLLKKYFSVSGKRIFLPLNLLNHEIHVPREIKERKQPVYMRQSYTWIDSISFELPKEYFAEYLPEEVSEKTIFGEYSYVVNREGNTITYVRKQVMYAGVYPKEQYEVLREFLNKIRKHDKVKTVFQKKT